MSGLIRFVSQRDVESLAVEVPPGAVSDVERALGRDWHEVVGAHGVAAFEVRDRDSLVRAAEAAGIESAASEALVALETRPGRSGECWGLTADDEPFNLRAGDRIRLVRTDDPYTQLGPDAEGTVERIAFNLGDVSVDVRWDDGSTLSLIPASGDRWERVGS